MQARGRRHAFYPVGIAAVVGLPLAMLHQASSPHLFHCEGCGLDFQHRTTAAKIARVVLFAVCIALALVVVSIVTIVAIRSS